MHSIILRWLFRYLTIEGQSQRCTTMYQNLSVKLQAGQLW